MVSQRFRISIDQSINRLISRKGKEVKQGGRRLTCLCPLEFDRRCTDHTIYPILRCVSRLEYATCNMKGGRFVKMVPDLKAA